MKFEGGFGPPYIGLQIILLSILLPGYTVSVANYERRCRQSAEMEDTYGSKEKGNGTSCKDFCRMH